MTTRRYLVSMAIMSKDTGATSFYNKVVNIEGDLEQGIEKLRIDLQKASGDAGVSTFLPAILNLMPLENIRPPEYVELPTTVRQSMEQIVIDYIKGKLASVADVNLMDKWLNAIKGAE